jgi:ankyrin repeat protein
MNVSAVMRAGLLVLAAIAASAIAATPERTTLNHVFPGVHGQLVYAAERHDYDQMVVSIRHGANPNYIGAARMTPLLWMISRRNNGGLKLLLRVGADPNLSGATRGTPLVFAARLADPEAFRILLRHGANPNQVSDCLTPLMAAIVGAGVHKQGTQRIDLLLAHGADINVQACSSGAPEIAVDMGRFDLVVYLLSKGYSAKLENLVSAIRWRRTPPEARDDKLRALQILRTRGIKIPPEAERDDD